MNIAWVTGASAGLGKAICLNLLERGWYVTGISRHHTIEHSRYTAVSADLSDSDQTREIEFSIPEQARFVLLIHNAGTLGEIGTVGNISGESIDAGFQVNLTAVALLTNQFMNQTQSCSAFRSIVGISSGAARNPYDGWAMYCASKAGMDMFFRVLKSECVLKQDQRTAVYSIAPGIIETAMQAQIREASVDRFSAVERFRQLHAEGQLLAPELVAQLLIELIEKQDTQSEVCLDLRSLKR